MIKTLFCDLYSSYMYYSTTVYYCGRIAIALHTLQTYTDSLYSAYNRTLRHFGDSIHIYTAIMAVTCDACLSNGYVGIELCGYHGILIVGGQTLRALAVMSQPYGMEGAG